MSNANQETIADIVREMRTLGRLDEKSTDKIPRSLQALGLRTYADRIKAAAKREREAGAEAAQICGEMIGREETREKSSQVGNAAKMREALGEISQKIWESIDPFCNDDCCKPRRELAKIADAALSTPQRNCDVLSKDEVLEMLKDRSFSKEDTIEWLYGKAEGDTK